MKKTMKLISFLVLILMAVPIFVKAEESETIVLSCDTAEFKVGTSRTCHVTIHDIDSTALLSAELGEGLTMGLATTNDNYSIELVGEQLYLLTKGASVTEPAELDVTLSLASDADIDKTGIELKLYKHFNDDYTIPSEEIGVSSGTVLFDVDCTPSKTPEPPKEEKVNVPDTASNISTFIYVGGALCMAFGVYLIVQSRKTVNE